MKFERTGGIRLQLHALGAMLVVVGPSLAGPTVYPQSPEQFDAGDNGRTGTQGVQGNPDCPPPTIIENGRAITPRNWSCNSSSYWAKRAPDVRAYNTAVPGRAGPPPNPAAANACLPAGPGGYDFCANASNVPRPPGCVCGGSGIRLRGSADLIAQGPEDPANANVRSDAGSSPPVPKSATPAQQTPIQVLPRVGGTGISQSTPGNPSIPTAPVTAGGATPLQGSAKTVDQPVPQYRPPSNSYTIPGFVDRNGNSTGNTRLSGGAGTLNSVDNGNGTYTLSFGATDSNGQAIKVSLTVNNGAKPGQFGPVRFARQSGPAWYSSGNGYLARPKTTNQQGLYVLINPIQQDLYY